MVEVGESSSSAPNPSDEPWAKLIPLDTRYTNIEIRSDEVVVYSEISSSSVDKHGWCKIRRNLDLFSSTVQNVSSNAILVDEIVVQKEETVLIESGSEIIPGTDREGYLSYKFEIMPEGAEPENCQKQLKISIDVEHAKCSICLNIWHDVVTVAPCLHNFCNGCFSEWLRRSQEKHSSVLCPQCRAVVQFVGRNHFLHRIAEDIIQADSSLQRSNEEVALLDSYSSIQSNLVIGSGKKLNRKRAYSTLDEENVEVELLCPQCVTEYGGFRCNSRTDHLQCQACGGMMPSLYDTGVPQHCLGCDGTFCGAYWQSHRVLRSDTHVICSPETFKPISERTISRIPPFTHESNRHEKDITERCITQMGRTLQDVVSDWITKLNNREIDRTRMPLNHAEMITAETHICNDCYDKLVAFLLYWFRISTPVYLLPGDASKRENCWYDMHVGLNIIVTIMLGNVTMSVVQHVAIRSFTYIFSTKWKQIFSYFVEQDEASSNGRLRKRKNVTSDIFFCFSFLTNLMYLKPQLAIQICQT